MRLTQEEQALVESALPTVHLLADRFARRFARVPRDEFLSVGHEAAVMCVRTYDAARGIPFGVFAFKRIRGEMMRTVDREQTGDVQRFIRKAFAADDAIAEPPGELDLDQALEDTPEKARDRAVVWARKQTAGMLLAALFQQATRSVGGEESLVRAEQRLVSEDALRAAMTVLDAREKHFIDRFYRDEATMEEIAAELGVVKRTIVRVHDRIKEKLANKLRKAGVSEPPPSSRV